jgi:hypothetical protein
MNAYERTSYFDLGQTVKFIETLGVEDSQATLLRALQAGKIVATGCRIAFNPSDAIDNNQFPRHLRGMGVREIITPHGWADLTFGTVSGGALGV